MVVLITGASSGIGRALAQHYLSQGRIVVAIARRTALLEELGREATGQLCIFPADVTDREAMAGIVAEVERRVGPIDLAIAAAGVADQEAGADFDPVAAERMMITNVCGTFNVLAPIAANMRRRGSGQIVAISSLAALQALPHMTAYCASKAALNVGMDGMRFQLHGSGVRVTTICPGFIATPMTADRIRSRWCMPLDKAMPRILRAIQRRQRVCYFPFWSYLCLRAFDLLPAPARIAVRRAACGIALPAPPGSRERRSGALA
jgi:short-subunit dehydrogenase